MSTPIKIQDRSSVFKYEAKFWSLANQHLFTVSSVQVTGDNSRSWLPIHRVTESFIELSEHTRSLPAFPLVSFLDFKVRKRFLNWIFGQKKKNEISFHLHSCPLLTFSPRLQINNNDRYVVRTVSPVGHFCQIISNGLRRWNLIGRRHHRPPPPP